MKKLSRGLRAIVLVAILAAAPLILSCFDAPILQELELLFNADGSVKVRAVTSIRSSWRSTDNPRVTARLDAISHDILHEQDLWARAVRAMGPERERISHYFEEGVLVSSTRQALATDPRAVEKLFLPTPVSAFVRQDERTITLELVPSGATDATYRQKRKVEEATETFAASVALYLGTLADVYARLDEHPSEVRAAMASLLDISDEDADSGELSDERRRQLDLVDEASNGLAELLNVSGGEAYTLDELSRLVYDPFPAPVTIEVAGDVLESEGFVSGGEGRFATQRHSLWDALSILSERWVTPLPMVAVVAALRAAPSPDEVDEESLLESVLAAPRWVNYVPDEAEVRAAIIQQLRPPKYYLMRWSLPAGE
jgi:hypothetical protein